MQREKITKEIELPDGVSVSIGEQILLIKGPKGEDKRDIKKYDISIKTDNKKIILESNGGTKKYKKIAGSLTAHIKNMIRGTLQNYIYTLKICSGHFPMNISIANNKLIIKNFLGEKVPRVLQLKHGADVKVEGDLIYVTSPSKETAGQISGDIEQLTRRPGYDCRVFQDGIYLVNRDGKELK